MFSSTEPQQLSVEDEEKLAKQEIASEFKRLKLEREARANWDRFYKRNKDNFFKDRYWSSMDIQEACSHLDLSKSLTYLEAGCGVGNMLFPLAEAFPHWRFQAFDFSANAVSLLKERGKDSALEVAACECDLTENHDQPPFGDLADIATLIYVVSGIHPEKHAQVARNMLQMIKHGGALIVRDYAVNDHAMVRFGRASKLDERFYARQDGTRAFFFTIEEVCSPFEAAGFRRERAEYLHRRTVNHGKGVDVPRVFVQALFVRPIEE